jgi:hypothetical protein
VIRIHQGGGIWKFISIESGTGRPIPKMPNPPLQSSGKSVRNNWHSDIYDRFRPPKNMSSTRNDNPADFQRFALESLRNFKEFTELVSQIAQYSSINAIPVMNLRFANHGTTLGVKGHICEKCFSFEIAPILNDEKMTSLKSKHMCGTQSQDIAGTIFYKRKQELIFQLTSIVNYMAKQHELVDLAAVEIPASVFDSRLDSYEDHVDLDYFRSSTPNWAHHAIKERKIVINRTDLAEFLDIFIATLGFFKLTIDGEKRCFFVYIANELEPSNIKYLEKLLRLEPTLTTGMGVPMNHSAINKEWKDIFIEGPHTMFPLRPDKFSFRFQNPSTAQTLNISNEEWDEIRERQENDKKPNAEEKPSSVTFA